MTLERLVHLACGPHTLPDPWENYDLEVDLRRPLPFRDGDVDVILLEHAIEHLSSSEAYDALREVHRSLRPGGILRVSFPDVELIATNLLEYEQLVAQFDETKAHCIEKIAKYWGHKTLWSYAIMKVVLESIGFADLVRLQHNRYRDARLQEGQVDRHHLTSGRRLTLLETSAIECVRKDATWTKF